MPTPQSSDVDIVAVVAEAFHDDEAKALLARTVRDLVTRYARARFATLPYGLALADEVANQVCEDVLDALPRFRRTARAFEPFVYTVSERRAGESARRAQGDRRMRARLLATWTGSEAPAVPAVIAGRLVDLPSHLRDVLILRIVLGLGLRRTGRWLGMSPTGVRLAQRRAVSRVRESYRESAHDEQAAR